MRKRSLLVTLAAVFTLAVTCSMLFACGGDKNPESSGCTGGGTMLEVVTGENGIVVNGGGFAQGSVLVAEKISTDSAEGKAALDAIKGQEYNPFKPVYVYDISVVKDNAKVQPNGKVRVSIPVTADLATYRAVLHIKSDGSVERLSATYADGKISFETYGFSVFVLVEPVITNIHEHVFSKEWSQSETQHWHACLGEKCDAKEDLADHYYSGSWDVIKEATATETGLVVRVCIGCKYEDRYTIPTYDPDHVHTYETTWSKNEYAHWHAATCVHVNEAKDYAAHDWNDGVITTPATDDADGVKTCTCTVCGATMQQKYAHEHTFAAEWSKNETHHWHAATCSTSEVSDKAEHDWNDGEITTPATADKDGVKTYTCTTCGKTKEGAFVYVPHTHTFSTTWSKDDDYHWYVCTSEDCTEVSGKAAHTWGDPVVKREPGHIEGGCTEYTCSICGRIKQVLTEHQHIYKDWQFAPTYHWQIANCGNSTGHNGIRGPQSAHDFEDGFCKDCGIKDPSVASTGLEFTLQEDGTYFVSGIGTCTDIHLVIPSEHENKAVTGVANQAFSGKGALRSVYLPDSVKTVGDRAFKSCSNLNSVRLPDDMNSIGEYAFDGCELYTLTLPTKGLSEIKKYAFNGNYQYLLSIYIPDNITTIGEYAFNYCRSVTELRLPETMSSLGASCFKDLQAITSITIPKGIKELPDNVFENCYGLTEVTVPDWIETIGNYAFSGCKNLTTVHLSDGLTSIGEYAFQSTKLTSVTIPSSITELKLGVFNRCSELTEVVLPEGLVTIGKLAFANCSKLAEITLPAGLTAIGEQAFKNSGLESIVIPEKITVINPYTFNDCSKLSSVTLPEGLLKIDQYAFSSCAALESISIPNGVTEISTAAFRYCSKLTTVNVPTSLAKISNSVFASTKIKNIVIPDSVTAIESYAFSCNAELESVTFGKNITSIGSSAFEECVKLASIDLPSSLKSIDSRAFAGCKQITTVTLPSSLESIGYAAFIDCSNLTTVTIPSGIKKVEYSVFDNTKVTYTEYYNAYYLGNEENPYLVLIQVKDKTATSCTIHTSTVIIAGKAFNGSAITEITIPDNVKVIGGQAFDYTLNKLYIGSIDNWCMLGGDGKTCVKISEYYKAYWSSEGASADEESRANILRGAASGIFHEGYLPSDSDANGSSS